MTKRNKIIFLIPFFLFVFLLTSCQLYFQTNKDEIQKICDKTQMKPFSNLDEPFVFTIPVKKDMHLFGNKSEDVSSFYETVGNVFVVYDWNCDSVFDWAFFESRNANTSVSNLIRRDLDNNYPICQRYWDSFIEDDAYIRKTLNSSSGKIENTDYGKTGYCYTKNFYVCISNTKDKESDNSSTQNMNSETKIKILNADMTIFNTISVPNYIKSYCMNKHFFVMTKDSGEDIPVWKLFILKDDGSSLFELGSFSNLKDTDYYFENATDDFVFIEQINKLGENQAGTPIIGRDCILAFKIDGTFSFYLTNPEDQYIFDEIITYKDDFYFLNNNLDSREYILYKVKSDIENQTEEKIVFNTFEQKLTIPREKILPYRVCCKQQGSKFYILSEDSYKNHLRINYINLDNFTFNDCEELSLSLLLKK